MAPQTVGRVGVIMGYHELITVFALCVFAAAPVLERVRALKQPHREVGDWGTEYPGLSSTLPSNLLLGILILLT